MSCWTDELVPMLRILTGDLAAPLKYSDDRLESVIVVAAQYATTDVHLDIDYTISVANTTISPDPTNPRDVDFITLTILKAACLVDQWTFRSEALKEGIRIVCGPAQLSVAGRSVAFRTLLELGPCKTYDQAVAQFNFGDKIFVKGILSPFVSNDFNPQNLGYYNTGEAGGFENARQIRDYGV